MAKRQPHDTAMQNHVMLPQLITQRHDKAARFESVGQSRSASSLGFRVPVGRDMPSFGRSLDSNEDIFADWRIALERSKERFHMRKKNLEPIEVQRPLSEFDAPPKYFSSEVKSRLLRDPSVIPLNVDVSPPDHESAGTNRDRSSRGSVRGTAPRMLSRSSSICYSARQMKTAATGRNTASPGIGSKYLSTLKSEIYSMDTTTGEVTIEINGTTTGKADIADDAERATAIYNTITNLKNINHVKISRYKLGTSGADILGAAIARYTNLGTLLLHEAGLSSAGATAISRGLSQVSSLSVLSLDGNAVGGKGLRAMSDALPTCAALTHISLAGNGLACEGASVIARCLIADARAGSDLRPGCARSLTALLLRGNNIGPAGCAELCGGLLECGAGAILDLDLSDNPLTACGTDFAPIAALGAALGAMPALRSLDLSNTELYAEGGRLVVDGLTHKERDLRQRILAAVRRAGEERRGPDGDLGRLELELKEYQAARPLQYLNLDRNLVSAESLNALGEHRCLFNGLRALRLAASDLTGNRYNPTFHSVSAFASGLRSARYLEVLSLSDNRLSSEDGEQSCFPIVCEALLQLPNLRHLDLARNNLALREVQRLASVFGRLGKLLVLSLRANRLGSDGLKSLAPALRHTLTDLDLAENGIGPDGITALAMRLSDVTNLTRLDLSRNHFSAVLGDYMDHHSERTLVPLAPVSSAGGADGGAATASSSSVRASATRASKSKYSAIFRTVAKKMSEAGSEVRKAALFGNAFLRNDAIQRGFPLFARRCAEHLVAIRVIVLGLPLEAGRIRGGSGRSAGSGGDVTASHGSGAADGRRGSPIDGSSSAGATGATTEGDRSGSAGKSAVAAPEAALDFSGRSFGKEDTILFFELLRRNTALTGLRFAGNDLTDSDEADSVRAGCLADWLGHARGLTALDLTDSRLHLAGAHLLAGGLRHATCLRELRLQGCGLTLPGFQAIGRSIAQLSALTHLDLSNNLLAADPHKGSGSIEEEAGDRWGNGGDSEIGGGLSMDALRSCAVLEVLDLRRCCLRDGGAAAAAAVLRHLTSLLHLFVAENEIGVEGQEEIATSLRSCPRIQSTDNLQAPGAGQRDWSLRGRIDFAYQVSFVASCVKRHALTSLDVSMNGLGRFPASFLAFASTLRLIPTVTELDLSDNGPCSERVCQTLALSIRALSDLQVLKLSNNSISGEGASALMCSIITLRELRLLDVQHNLFHFAPCALAECCSNLQRLDLLYNPWLAPSQRVMEKKTYREIKEGMMNLYGDGVINMDLVLGFVGVEDVGKSALISALLNSNNKPHPNATQSTLALEIRKWQPRAQEGPTFTVYDFSGLSTYRPVQDLFFLPRRALYCLVWRPFAVVKNFEYSDQNQALDLLQNEGPFFRIRGQGLCTQDQLPAFLENQVRSWISTLYRRVPGCNVMLCVTHMDCTTEESLQWQCDSMKKIVKSIIQELDSKYNGSINAPKFLFECNSMWVSSESGSGIAELREKIITSAEALPFYGELLPKSWARACHALRAEASKSQILPLVKTTKKDANKRDFSGSSFHHLLRTGTSSAVNHEQHRVSLGTSTNPSAGEKGFMRMVYFKKLLKDCAVDDCHMLPALRYFHDAGWLRFFGFNEDLDTGFPLSEKVEGFEYVDAYRSTAAKIATNSTSTFRSKVPPENVREKDWTNIFDTIIINLEWFVELTATFIVHDATNLVASIDEEDNDLQREAIALIEKSTLVWKRGSPILIGHLWGRFMSEPDFRIIRNLLVASQVFEYQDSMSRNLLLVTSVLEEVLHEDKGFYISFDTDLKGQKREIDVRPFVKLTSYLTQHISKGSTYLSAADTSDSDIRRNISECRVCIIIMTDSYFDSLRCRTEFMAAVDLCLHIVPIITSDCSGWPPGGDGVWLPSRNMIHWPPLSRVIPFDFSLAEFGEILHYFEDDDSVYVGLCGEVHSDPLFTHLLDLITTDVQSIQTVHVDHWLAVYRRFQSHMKRLYTRLAASFCKKSLFPSGDTLPHNVLRTFATSWQESKDRASRVTIQAEELQSLHDSSGGSVVVDESSDEVNLRRIKAGLHQIDSDPWHAKLGALKAMANIHKGLGTSPLWHLRDAVMEELETLQKGI